MKLPPNERKYKPTATEQKPMVKLIGILRLRLDKDKDWKVDAKGLTIAQSVEYFDSKNIPLTETQRSQLEKGHCVQIQHDGILYRPGLDRYVKADE